MSLLAAVVLVGCAANGGGGGDIMGDDDGDVPFTNGVSTLTGASEPGYVDGSRKLARFANPVNVAYRDGLLYVADFDNGKLRVVDVDTHNTGTVISQTGFKRPFGLAFASDGTLYVSTDNDPAGNHNPMSGTIWKVDVEARTAKVIAADVGRPRGMAVLPDGRLVVADYLHHVIQTVNVTNGQVTPIAGAWDVKGMVDAVGVAARFSSPYYVAVRGDGKLLVTDYDNHRIRLVSMDGTTTTAAGATEAGFVDGPMNTARFNHPQAMSVAANGDVYVTDLGNFRVRRIVGDRVETIAGNGKGGWVDNDDRLASELFGLEGLSVVPDGSMVYVADGNRGEELPHNRVRQIKLN
jgi:NHL repeat